MPSRKRVRRKLATDEREEHERGAIFTSARTPPSGVAALWIAEARTASNASASSSSTGRERDAGDRNQVHAQQPWAEHLADHRDRRGVGGRSRQQEDERCAGREALRDQRRRHRRRRAGTQIERHADHHHREHRHEAAVPAEHAREEIVGEQRTQARP